MTISGGMNGPDGLVATQRLLTDIEAALRLRDNEAARLDTVRARSAKWLGAITALTGLIGTVVILKGPDTIDKLDVDHRKIVAALIVSAMALLVIATLCVYAGAYGSPAGLDELSATPIRGLSLRLKQARAAAATTSENLMLIALLSTILGIAVLFVAIGVTWFPPVASNSDTSTCVMVNGKQIAKIESSSIDVSQLGPGVVVARCPS